MPLSALIQKAQMIRVLHRYDEGMRLVTAKVGPIQWTVPRSVADRAVAEVRNPVTEGLLGWLDKAGRYIPHYEARY